MREQVYLPNPTISASSLKDYLSCKRKLYYRIIKAKKIISPYMVVGQYVHDAILANIVTGTTDISKYPEGLIRDLATAEFKRGEDVLGILSIFDTCFNNYLLIKEVLPEIVKPEWEFKFPYYNVSVVGRVDGLCNSPQFVEFKTSKYLPTQITLDIDLQLTFYAWAYEHIFHSKPLICYVHLPTASVYHVRRENYYDLEEIIDRYTDDIRENYFPREHDAFKCGNCEYRNICIESNENNKCVSAPIYVPRPERPNKLHRFAET